MKTNDKQLDRLINEIEGRLNDFETGESEKEETIKSFAGLIGDIAISVADGEKKKVIELIDEMINASREKDKTDLEELRRRKDMELADEMLSESLGYRMSLIDLREKI